MSLRKWAQFEEEGRKKLSKASDQEIHLKNLEESQNGEIDLAVDF